MIYSIYTNQDTTLYEGNSVSATADIIKYRNTGIDEILEISKIVSSSNTAGTYISRVLTQFNIDFAKLNAGAEFNWASSSAYLNLYATEVIQPSATPTFTIAAISQSWVEGKGRENNKPVTTDGSSWTNRFGDGGSGSPWKTGSFNAGSNGNGGQAFNGGGTWYVDSSSTYNYPTNESQDFRANVTDIVAAWSSSHFPNYGMIAALTASNETGPTIFGSHKFFSRNTHTIYPPRLEICWDDMEYVTGSNSALDMSDTGAVFFYLKNNGGTYKRGSKIKFNVNGRLKYPVKTYGTTSAELGIYYVNPERLQYSIIDCKTNETIIPYDAVYTKVSIGATEGNYFEIYSDSLFEERYYKIQLRYRPTTSSIDYTYYDIKDTFKVVR